MSRTLTALALVPTLALVACATQQDRIAAQESQLSAAGFIVRPANNPTRQAMLQQLPLGQILRRVHDDSVTYVYADPLVCGCLYVGTQDAFNRYQYLLQQQRIADQQQMTAQMYQNAAWNWNAWGPWGPGFAFGPGPGW